MTPDPKVRWWSVPPMWQGQTAAILASGPSMNASVAQRVRDASCRVVVVNTTFRLAPWADLLYASDLAWWQKYHPETEHFLGLKASCSEVPFPDVLRVKDSGREGFDPDPSCIRTGGNSGYAALHLAVHAGCKRILLCGFDMRGGHWHERHPHPLRDHSDGIYARWIARYATLVEPLRERGVEVLNCTPDSALTHWPRRTLDQVLGAPGRLEIAA